MTGTRRQAHPPGHQIPNDGAEQRAKHRRHGDDLGVDDAFSDRGGYGCPHERAGEIEESRERDRLARRQHFRGDDGGDRVRRIVEAVDVFERDGREHHDDEQNHAACLEWRLRILEHDLENDVPRVAATVDHFFEKLVEIAQENDLLGVVIAVKQIAQQFELQLIRVAFDRLQPRIFLAGGRDISAFAQCLHHRQDGLRSLVEQFQMLLETAAVEFARKNQDPLSDLFHRLRNLVKRRCQGLNVLSFQRRDERLAELFRQLLGDLFVFSPAVDEIFQAFRRLVELELREQRDQMMHAAVRLLRACFEQVEKLFVVSQKSSD